MGKIVIGKEEYVDKVRGCWLGKNIGGTLGAPFEGEKYTHGLTYYDWENVEFEIRNKMEQEPKD